MLLFRQPCVQFGLQATRPLKDYPRNNYELCLIGLIILWIRHCNCTAACGRLGRLVVHCENSSSCLKFAFTQTFVKEALCNDITCRSAIYLKFHGLFPKNQRCKQLSCVLLVCYSIRLQLGRQFERIWVIIIAFNVAVLCISCLKLFLQ